MYAIEARNLRKSFKGVRAVDGIDLCVEHGDVVALLGPNGAGKTTTIMMLLGVTEPDDGDVTLLGHRLPHGLRRALHEVNFAATYVGAPDRIRIKEVLRVYAGLYGVGRERVDEVIEMFGLGEFLDRYGSQLSSGQKTIVGLAKALLNRPRLLVLDEPTASLDPEVAARVRDILTSQHAQHGFTLLITSHNMSEIERLCRRVVFIAAGRIVADGSPIEINTRYGAADLEQTFLSIAAEGRA